MDISDKEFTLTKTLKDKINYWLRFAILAPSAHNTQPWKCKLNDDVLEIHRDEAFTLESDPTSREAHISIGAFIENFVVTVRAHGYSPNVEITAFSPDELLVARIRVTRGEHPEKKLGKELFNVIAHRRTNRGSYVNESLTQEIKNKLISHKMDLVKSFVFYDTKVKERIGRLVATGTKVALSLRSMKRELAHYVYSERDSQETGMPIKSMVSGPITNFLSSDLIIKFLDPGRLADENERKYSTSPALIIIGSTEDGPLAWINAGRLMERLLLVATAEGLNHDISAAPVEIPTLFPLLRREVPPEFRPQVLFRIGRAKNRLMSIRAGRRTVTV